MKVVIKMNGIKKILDKQRSFYSAGKTRGLDFRTEGLNLLFRAIKKYEDEIMEALKSDLNKSPFEVYAAETGIVVEEISFMLKKYELFFKSQESQDTSVGKIIMEKAAQHLTHVVLRLGGKVLVLLIIQLI